MCTRKHKCTREWILDVGICIHVEILIAGIEIIIVATYGHFNLYLDIYSCHGSRQPPGRIKIAKQNLVITRDGVCVQMLFISTFIFFFPLLLVAVSFLFFVGFYGFLFLARLFRFVV